MGVSDFERAMSADDELVAAPYSDPTSCVLQMYYSYAVAVDWSKRGEYVEAGGVIYGANAWPANSRDRRYYEQGGLDEGDAEEPSGPDRR